MFKEIVKDNCGKKIVLPQMRNSLKRTRSTWSTLRLNLNADSRRMRPQRKVKERRPATLVQNLLAKHRENFRTFRSSDLWSSLSFFPILIPCFSSLFFLLLREDALQVERQGVGLVDPSRHTRELAAEEEKAALEMCKVHFEKMLWSALWMFENS